MIAWVCDPLAIARARLRVERDDRQVGPSGRGATPHFAKRISRHIGPTESDRKLQTLFPHYRRDCGLELLDASSVLLGKLEPS